MIQILRERSEFSPSNLGSPCLGRLSTYASSELFQPIGLNTIMVCYTLGLLYASHYAYESFGINKMEVAVSVFKRLLEFDKSFSQ